MKVSLQFFIDKTQDELQYMNTMIQMSILYELSVNGLQNILIY